ncbi:hypothetical protein [Pseudomonas phage Ppu-503]|nr:hypothetical protein [Pseudomonas phage Ppu-503]
MLRCVGVGALCPSPGTTCNTFFRLDERSPGRPTTSGAFLCSQVAIPGAQSFSALTFVPR